MFRVEARSRISDLLGSYFGSNQTFSARARLRKKARIEVKKGKVFGWRNARYLRSRIGTELDINKTALQKMIGQSTGIIGRYTKGSDITKAARKLSRVLRMEPEKVEQNVNLEEKVNALKDAMNTLLDQIAVLGSSTSSFTGNPGRQIPKNYWEMDPWEKIEWYNETYGKKNEA